jgi:hypothetical protein
MKKYAKMKPVSNRVKPCQRTHRPLPRRVKACHLEVTGFHISSSAFAINKQHFVQVVGCLASPHIDHYGEEGALPARHLHECSVCVPLHFL